MQGHLLQWWIPWSTGGSLGNLKKVWRPTPNHCRRLPCGATKIQWCENKTITLSSCWKHALRSKANIWSNIHPPQWSIQLKKWLYTGQQNALQEYIIRNIWSGGWSYKPINSPKISPTNNIKRANWKTGQTCKWQTISTKINMEEMWHRTLGAEDKWISEDRCLSIITRIGNQIFPKST